MTETQIQRDILEWLDSRGYFCWRNISQPRYGKNKFVRKGTADIFFLCAGIVCAVEVKKVGGRVSAEQIEWGDKFSLAGGSYCVATCISDLEQHIRTI